MVCAPDVELFGFGGDGLEAVLDDDVTDDCPGDLIGRLQLEITPGDEGDPGGLAIATRVEPSCLRHAELKPRANTRKPFV